MTRRFFSLAIPLSLALAVEAAEAQTTEAGGPAKPSAGEQAQTAPVKPVTTAAAPAPSPTAAEQTATKPQPQVKPAAKPQPQPQVKPAAKPQPQVKPVAKPQPQVKPVAKPQPQVKPVAKPQPQVKPVAKPQPPAQPPLKPAAKPAASMPAAPPAADPTAPAPKPEATQPAAPAMPAKAIDGPLKPRPAAWAKTGAGAAKAVPTAKTVPADKKPAEPAPVATEQAIAKPVPTPTPVAAPFPPPPPVAPPPPAPVRVENRVPATELPAFVNLEQGRRALLAGRNYEAALYLGKAFEQGVGEPLALEWLGDAMRRVSSLESVLVDQQADLKLARFFPSGQRILTLSWFGSLSLWDGTTGRRIPQPAVPSQPIVEVVVSSDGQRFYSIDNRSQVQIWEPERGALVASLPAVDVSVVRISSDGRRLLTVSRGDRPSDLIQLWDMSTGKALAELRGSDAEGTTDVRFAPGGRYVQIERTEAVHKIRIWDTVEGRLKLIEEGMKAQFSADGRRAVVFGTGTRPQLFDLTTGKNYAQLRYQQTAIVETQFTLDGRRALTIHKGASPDGDGSATTACLWNVIEGSFVAVLGEKRGSVRQIVQSPDGRQVVTQTDTGTVSLWDTESGRKLAVLDDDDENEDGKTKITWSVSGRHILVRNPSSVGLYESASGREVQLGGTVGTLQDVSFSPSGLYLATISTDGTVRFWVTATGQQVGVVNQGKNPVLDGQWSPESAYFGILDHKHQLTVWEVADSRQRFTMSVSPLTTSIGFGSDVRYLSFSDSQQRIGVHRVDPGIGKTQTRTFSEAASGHTVIPLSMQRAVEAQFSADGQRLIVRDVGHNVIIWDTRSGKQLARIQGSGEDRESGSISPDGRYLVMVHTDGKSRLHDTTTGRALAEVPSGTLSYNSSSSRLAIGDRRGRVTVWDLPRGRMQSQSTGLGAELRSVRWLPDGKRIAIVSDLPLVRVMDAVTGRTLGEQRRLPANAAEVAVTPDGRFAVVAVPATAKVLGNVKLYPFDGSAPIAVQASKTTTPPVVFDFSRDGKQLFIEAQGKSRWLRPLPTGDIIFEQLGGVFAWSDESHLVFSAQSELAPVVIDTETGKKLWELPASMQDFQRVTFGPGGKHLLSLHNDDSVRIWETSSGRLVMSLAKPQSPLRDVRLSPDGKRLFTTHEDDAIRQWHVETGKLIAELKGLAANRILISPDGRTLFSSDENGRHLMWDIRAEQRTSAEVARWLRCFVPFRLDGMKLTASSVDPSECK
jgi:WD40 repeat protein